MTHLTEYTLIKLTYDADKQNISFMREALFLSGNTIYELGPWN